MFLGGFSRIYSYLKTKNSFWRSIRFVNMEMEKICEFCRLLRPVVYCKADAAHLCLACDAKVHSANALSSRHPRTLVCELCRHHPAHVRCSNHQMFMCRGCDCSEHDFSSEHQKRVISSYTGCPSAKDLAALWGFDLKELKNSTLFGSTSNVTADEGGHNVSVSRQFCSQIGGSSVVSTVESITTTVSAKSNLKSRGKHTKASRKDIQQGKNSLVLQQILDLKGLQLSESSFTSSLGEGATWKKLHENSAKLLRHSDLCSDLQHENGLIEETTEKPFPLPFSQLDHLEDTGNPLNGDCSWQFKSPPQNNQLWPQNMQDLGVCDELRFLDDFKMPDFDFTFQNFEDIFGGEQDLSRSVLDDNDLTCSSLDNQPSVDTSDETSVQQSAHLGGAHPRLSAESSGYEYVESGTSFPVRREHPCHSADAESGRVEGGETVIRRHKEKNFRRHERQVQRTSYKRSKSDVKKRTKVLSMKAEGYESDTANATRSF